MHEMDEFFSLSRKKAKKGYFMKNKMLNFNKHRHQYE